VQDGSTFSATATLDVAVALLQQNLIRVQTMSAQLDALVAQVNETNTVIQSAIILIQGLRQQIVEAGTDQAKLTELVASLDASEQELAGAVANNP
jgi:hypothetical protein